MPQEATKALYETNSEEERKKAITYKSWTPPQLDSDDYGFEG